MRKHVVTITGGTSGNILLKGLAQHNIDITAIFSPFDSGGSSGRLRKEFGGISWGDIRRGLDALTREEDPYLTLTRLMEYRFPKESTLGDNKVGHCFGNLLLLSLARLEGDAELGLHKAELLFGLPEGRHVLASTFKSSDLRIELENGRKIDGGRQIFEDLRNTKIKRLFLEPNVSAAEATIHAISCANIVVIGPGAFYNSVLPNLLVEGISVAIRRTKAPVAFVCNILTEKRQTDSMKGSDFVKVISDYLGIVPHFSIFNNKYIESKKKGKEIHGRFIDINEQEIRSIGTIPKISDLLHDEYIDRHDSKKLAKIILELLEEV